MILTNLTNRLLIHIAPVGVMFAKIEGSRSVGGITDTLPLKGVVSNVARDTEFLSPREPVALYGVEWRSGGSVRIRYVISASAHLSF